MGTTRSGPVTSAAVMSATAIDPILACILDQNCHPRGASSAGIGKIDARLADVFRLTEANGASMIVEKWD